jgi:1-acyl-sn-glycerol-3-phosphate acyltransferase
MAEPPRPSPLYLVVGGLSWPVLKLVFRSTATGLEHLPPTGGFVLAANHWSNLDPWPLAIPLFPRRYLRFMAKSELFWFPLSAIITAGGGFRVRRGERDVEAVETAVALCRQGHVVVMFPEGTRRAKGLIKKHQPAAKPGAARIALAAGVPLVPAAVAGTNRLLQLARLRVAYGSRIPLDDLAEAEPRAAADVATARLMAEIHRLEEALA